MYVDFTFIFVGSLVGASIKDIFLNEDKECSLSVLSFNIAVIRITVTNIGCR